MQAVEDERGQNADGLQYGVDVLYGEHDEHGEADNQADPCRKKERKDRRKEGQKDRKTQ